jgi:glyoxylase-like metal-dependent hydrolase (beta-lactamase superfamily II)
MSNANTRLIVTISFVLYLSGAAVCLARQQPLTVQQIKGNIYMVKGGSGANTGFFIGDREVLVIDAKMTADSTKQEISEIRKLTDKPVTRIVITHSDGDHVNGLNGFPTGLKIYAHPQTKKDMEEAAKAANTQHLNDYLPNEVCAPCAASKSSVMGFKIGSEEVLLYYFGPAHTSGDLVVFFPAERVAFVGDLAFVGRDPLIHRQKGGTSIGYVDTLKAMLALKAETFISGHNEPLSNQDIQALAASIEEKQGKVKALIAEGKSFDDIRKAFGIQTAAAQPGRTSFPSLIEVIYLELTERK